MKNRLIGASFVLFVAGITSAWAQSLDKAVDQVRPALVRIFVVESSFEQGRESLEQIAGSGVVISPDGYIVTNHHVAGWAKRIFCTLPTKERVEADLIGTDALTDISVIKIRSASGTVYPFAKWGSSSKLKVGDPVLAMGSPLALSQSVTKGVVSNTELTMPDYMGSGAMTLDGEDVGSMVLWIGHDAKISPGNSGGPLVNLEGEVVGINEIEFGLGGAIPSDIAHEVADEIIRNKGIKRAFLGISVQPLLQGITGNQGVLVCDVIRGGPADKAGVKSGDVIIRVGDNNVYVRYNEQMPAYNRMVAALPVGQAVKVSVLRDGQPLDVTVTPTDRKSAESHPKELKSWGVCVTDISESEAQAMKRTTDGVMIYSVRPSGAAGIAKPAIAEYDIVTAINNQPVKNVSDFVRITDTLMASGKPVAVLLAIERDGEKLVTVTNLGVKDTEDKGLETRKPSLGIGTQVLSPEIAKALNVEGRTGFRVTRVNKGSSAEKAGLKVGDLLFAVDGIHLEASQPEDAEELNELIRQYDIGSTVKLALIRGVAKQTLSIKLTEPDRNAREMKRYRDTNFEFVARDLTNKDRAERELDQKADGVWIEEVTSGGWAALGKLKPGDVVLSISGKTVSNVDTMKELFKEITTSRTKSVIVKVLRSDGITFVELEADWSGAN
jgi:serine protease Do